MAIDGAMARRYVAELIGTAVLVFFGAGMAAVTFGFRAFGSSVSAGMLVTGLTFALVLLGLVAVIGPISGCHVNPAVTLGAFLAKRISAIDLAGYWIAQLIGGLLGALLLLWVLHSSPFYSKARIGLGANGYGRLSLLHASGGGAFLTEVILTAVFVLVVLSATRKAAPAPVAGLIVGFALGLVNIMGIPIDGASVNPARSFGPAVIVGGLPLSQLWVFLLAPLVGGAVGTGVYLLFFEARRLAPAVGEGDVNAESSMVLSAADDGRETGDDGRGAGASQATTGGTQASGPASRGAAASEDTPRPDPPKDAH